jgi:hypothetical protein
LLEEPEPPFFLVGREVEELVEVVVLCWVLLGFCDLTGRVGTGVFDGWVDVDDVVVDPELEVEVLPAVVVVDVLVGVDELDGEATHDSVSETTTPVIGRFMAEIGVPGGTLTVKLRVLPPRSVTWTVHVSAAAGEAAESQTAAMAPMRRATSSPSARRGRANRHSTISIPPPLCP